MNNNFCCEKQVEKLINETGEYIIKCNVCKQEARGKSEEEVTNKFFPESKIKPKTQKKDKQNVLAPVQKNDGLNSLINKPENIGNYITSHMSEIMDIAAPFVARDKPALKRMITNNIKYVLSRKEEKFLQCWKTQEGVDSLIAAIEEAFSLGAEMPGMGCIVPFGKTAEFIPAVEAYEFALTAGNSATFAWIQIEPIYENDTKTIKIINGEFQMELTPKIPRGEVEAVAVYGHYNKLNKVIGEVYDVERLIKKAETHSKNYRYYLNEINAFEHLKSEGKIKTEYGREYYEKQIPKKGGNGTWNKKIFRDELSNPYDGADRPEMLRKAAGKSFLSKFAKIRNSEAAIEEMKGEKIEHIEQMLDSALDEAQENLGDS